MDETDGYVNLYEGEEYIAFFEENNTWGLQLGDGSPLELGTFFAGNCQFSTGICLDYSYLAGGCNGLGAFEIIELSYHPVDQRLLGLAVNFVYACDPTEGQVRGSLRFQSDIAIDPLFKICGTFANWTESLFGIEDILVSGRYDILDIISCNF